MTALQATRAALAAQLAQLEGLLARVSMPSFDWETPAVDGVPTADRREAAVAAPIAPKPWPPAPETLAARQLEMANNYLGVGMKGKAAALLTSLMEGYPQTKAAQQARQLLGQTLAQ